MADFIPTPNLRMFAKANEESPVVEGVVIGTGGKGAIYHLEDGRSFELTAEECRNVKVRWYLGN